MDYNFTAQGSDYVIEPRRHYVPHNQREAGNLAAINAILDLLRKEDAGKCFAARR